jgi:ribosomal protein L37AE/L43A
MKRADKVKGINGTTLHCGSGRYEYAIVVNEKPLVLVSPMGDMLWSASTDTMQLEVIGTAEWQEWYTAVGRYAIEQGWMETRSETLNIDHDEARALHRVVRAMHDGECPKCHKVFDAKRMREAAVNGWRCPSCMFLIRKEEADAVFAIFAPFMERNLAIFEEWRDEVFKPSQAS